MHTLICGVTETGKTTLAHLMAQQDATDKKQIVVFDPVGTGTVAGEWPEEVYFFNDPGKFMRWVTIHGGAETRIYVDESADILSHEHPENQWLLTRGRHLGYSMTIITQRPKMIRPSAREQCARLCMFRLGMADQRELGANYGHNGFDKLNLDRGEFVVVYSGSARYKRHNVFELAKSPRRLTL